MIIPFEQKSPTIDDSSFIAPDAWVIGDVTIGARCSILFGAILRGDLEPILIGNGTNIQDQTIIHTTKGSIPTTVGENVTIGHRVTLHSCTIDDMCLIGMGSIILDEAIIGAQSIVGAGSLITQKKIFPPRSLILGTPAKVVRELTEEEIENPQTIAKRYQQIGRIYQGEL